MVSDQLGVSDILSFLIISVHFESAFEAVLNCVKNHLKVVCHIVVSRRRNFMSNPIPNFQKSEITRFHKSEINWNEQLNENP